MLTLTLLLRLVEQRAEQGASRVLLRIIQGGQPLEYHLRSSDTRLVVQLVVKTSHNPILGDAVREPEEQVGLDERPASEPDEQGDQMALKSVPGREGWGDRRVHHGKNSRADL